MKLPDTPLVINIDTGVITFRNAENATHANCRPISRDHALMVENGELELAPLLAAIKKHMMSASDFDFDKYTEARRHINVRRSALHADEKEKIGDAPDSDYVSDEDIEAAKLEQSGDEISSAVAEVKRAKTVRKPLAKKEAAKDEAEAESAFGKGGALF